MDYILYEGGELYHYGKKGMKWGQRLYQNKDGSLTEAGKRRYARDAREKGYSKQDEDGAYYKNAGKKGGRKETLDVDAERYVTEDMQRSKRVIDDTAQLSGKLKQMTDKSIKNTPKTRMDLSNMSDQDLRNRINRELLERQYNDVFNPPQVSKGKETASKIFETAGDVLVTAGAAVALATGIRELLKG